MCVSTLLKTVGRFTSLVPILQAQLMSILAQCAGQENLKSKEQPNLVPQYSVASSSDSLD